MRAPTLRATGGTWARRAVRHRARLLGRRLRHLGGRLHGLSYRLRGRHPDPSVDDKTLADRIRSILGPIERRLDLPRLHVDVVDHVAVLHGDVGTKTEAVAIEAAVAAVWGVAGVESYLHVGLAPGDTRPSAGRLVKQPSKARRQLLAAAESAGVDSSAAPAVVGAVLAMLAERVPDGERDQVAAHFPADIRAMFTPPRRLGEPGPVRTAAEFASRIAAAGIIPAGQELDVTQAILRAVRALVAEEAADVAAVLPPDLRPLWEEQRTH